MRQAAVVTYWFFMGVALFMILFGLIETLLVHRRGGILLLGLLVAATLYLAGVCARWMTQSSARDE